MEKNNEKRYVFVVLRLVVGFVGAIIVVDEGTEERREGEKEGEDTPVYLSTSHEEYSPLNEKKVHVSW